MLTSLDNDIARLVHLCDRMLERKCASLKAGAGPAFDPARLRRWCSVVIQWKRDRFAAQLPAKPFPRRK